MLGIRSPDETLNQKVCLAVRHFFAAIGYLIISSLSSFTIPIIDICNYIAEVSRFKSYYHMVDETHATPSQKLNLILKAYMPYYYDIQKRAGIQIETLQKGENLLSDKEKSILSEMVSFSEEQHRKTYFCSSHY